MKLLQRINSKIITAGILCSLVFTLGLFWSVQSKVSHLGNLSKLSLGINTCAARVSQSFSHLVVGAHNASYLTSSFLSESADCFNEVLNFYKSKINSVVPEIENNLNLLVSENYWFNEKIKKTLTTSANHPIDISNSVLMEKFSKVESVVEKTYDLTQNATQKMTESNSKMKFLFLVASLITFLLMSYLLLIDYFKKRKREFVESEALNFFNLNESLDQNKTHEFMSKSLNELKLFQMNNLYRSFYDQLLDHKESLVFKINNKHKITNSRKTKNLPVINIHESFNVALEKIKQKAFTHGVVIDFQIEEDSFCYGLADALEQVIFNILNSAIEASLIHNIGRKVVVRGKNLGGVFYLKSSIANYSFQNDEISFVDGGPVDEDEIDINLSVIKEMMKMMGGRVNLLNQRNEEGILESGTIELVLNRAIANDVDEFYEERKSKINKIDEVESHESLKPQPEVVSVIKGKKKDVLKQMSHQLDLQ